MPQALPNIQTFTTPEELARQLAVSVASFLRQDVINNGCAGLVVSGGSTPKPFFAQLARQNIDWRNITVTLADERWVDSSDDASNERLVRSTLLQDRAVQATLVPLKNNAGTAFLGEKKCHQDLAAVPRPFAAVILGMGNDGHTASLFPGAERLPDALDMQSGRNCIAITPVNAPLERMTLTLPALLDTNMIILHITGQDKWNVLQKALGRGPETEMPVRSILRQQKCPVHIYWAP